MRKYLFVIIIFSIFISGCSVVMKSKLSEQTLEKIVLTEQSQDAVFRIRTGWTGGMGSFPIMDEENRPQQYNDLAIYLDDVQAQKILEDNKMPGCWVGTPLIKISANITLEPQMGTNYSIPPDDNGKQPTESYYSAKINKIYEVLIKAEKCAD